MTESTQCPKCGWFGHEAKLSLCSNCDTVYYKCPECGSKTKFV